MPDWKEFFTGRSFFVILALLFLFLTGLFLVRHANFVFRELNHGFAREGGGDGLPQFDIEGFRKLNLIRQQ